MINKIVISAAGRGTRMGDLTESIPKPMIMVGDKPFVYYLLENIKKAGFQEIIVVVGYKAETIEYFLGKYDSNIKTVNQFEILGEEKYGTVCPLVSSESMVKQENFVFVYGDNLYSAKDLAHLRNLDNEYCYVSGIKHEKPENYGVLISSNDGYLAKIIERPEKFYTNLINTGLYKFTSEIFEATEKVNKSKRGEYELTDAITYLAEKKKVKINEIEDYWKDFGKPEDIPVMEKFVSGEFKV